MAWAWQFEGDARREFYRLDFAAQKRIVRYLDTRIAGEHDPRRFGKPCVATSMAFGAGAWTTTG